MYALKKAFAKYFPILDWGSRYNSKTLVNDLVVALIVTMMLIPQSLAYATLAGLQPEVGLYASMLPLILYAVFGTSSALAVGPVAVVSLMTATAISKMAISGTSEYLTAAIALALISGLILLVLGFLKMGFVANFLSHPVISGFITASGLQIAAGQLGPVLGIPLHGDNFLEIIISLWNEIKHAHFETTVLGLSVVVFLFFLKSGLRPLLRRVGLRDSLANMIVKVGPVLAIIVTTLVAWSMDLLGSGVRIVGEIPGGLPTLSLHIPKINLLAQLLVPAILISIVGYAESISVAQTLAAKKRERVDPDQELIALGASNIGSALSGGFPVTGGLSRSVVNFDAGAETPAAGAFTALGIALAIIFLTPLLYFLPYATLGALILVAILSLVGFGELLETWSFSKADFTAMLITIITTLTAGIETGLIAGVTLSMLLHLYTTSRPHIAIIGQIPGTAHFRNVLRHKVATDPEVISVRFDESIYFPNVRFLEDFVNDAVAANPAVKHFILECRAVNRIDTSALVSLEAINRRLKEGGIAFHLSEVKGPVMDQLKKSNFLEHLTGKVHLTHYGAVSSLNPDMAANTLNAAE